MTTLDRKMLAALSSEKASTDSIAAQMDFGAEYLLCVAWQGSTGDQLSYGIGSGEAGPDVCFHVTHGKTPLHLLHVHLYAVSRRANWLMSDNARFVARPEAKTPIARELDLGGFKTDHPLSFASPRRITNLKELADVHLYAVEKAARWSVLSSGPGAVLADAAAKKEYTAVPILVAWFGQIEPELAKGAPTGPILTQEAWQELWQTWRKGEATPFIDFEQAMVLVAVNNDFNRLGMGTAVDAAGDLYITLKSTLLDGPFKTRGYLFAVISRVGIKSIHGVPIGGK